MTKKLWQASLNQKKNSNLFAFESYISKKFNKKFNNDFQKILDWSIKNSSDFWDSFWDFTRIDGIKGKPIMPDSNESIVSIARWVLPVFVGPRTAVILCFVISTFGVLFFLPTRYCWC